MSKNLIVIAGRKEKTGQLTNTSVQYKNYDMVITSFTGPIDKGPMIQLHTDTDHIQLERNEVMTMVHILNTWLWENRDKFPK